MTTPSAFASTVLGRTGLNVSRLGLSSGYHMPQTAIEKAVEQGVNYLYWGSLRRDDFGQVLRDLRPKRDKTVLVLQSYGRWGAWVTYSIERALKRLQYDYADILLLGMWNKPIAPGVIDAAKRLKERGLVRYLGASTHERSLIPTWAAGNDLDLFHVRYNAVHRGAERDVFPHLPSENLPGMVSFTATCWRQLLNPKLVPKGEKVPTASDCYRFVLTQPSINVCLTGLTSMEQTDVALSAMQLGPMNDDELAWMRRVGDAIYKKKT